MDEPIMSNIFHPLGKLNGGEYDQKIRAVGLKIHLKYFNISGYYLNAQLQQYRTDNILNLVDYVPARSRDV